MIPLFPLKWKGEPRPLNATLPVSGVSFRGTVDTQHRVTEDHNPAATRSPVPPPPEVWWLPWYNLTTVVNYLHSLELGFVLEKLISGHEGFSFIYLQGQSKKQKIKIKRVFLQNPVTSVSFIPSLQGGGRRGLGGRCSQDWISEWGETKVTKILIRCQC